VTKFDQALEKARATQKNSDQENKAYLDLYLQFLDTEFYLPVDEAPDMHDDEAELSPLVFDEDGQEVIYFFDSQERLKEWAGKEKLYIAPLSGEDMLLTFGAERALVLNPHLDQVKEFQPDEIEFLFENFFQHKG
tara:strand:- start:86 stop:490 length:405 start_codon:yes stop_codon:yes gene_type:complete